MKLFVIHRFKDKKQAKKKLKKLAQNLSLEIKPIFLNSSGGEGWKQKAESAISQVEATIVFNPSSCKESENAKWEIEKTKEAGIEIIELNKNGNDGIFISRLKALYELKEEFDSCFSADSKDVFEM